MNLIKRIVFGKCTIRRVFGLQTQNKWDRCKLSNWSWQWVKAKMHDDHFVTPHVWQLNWHGKMYRQVPQIRKCLKKNQYWNPDPDLYFLWFFFVKLSCQIFLRFFSFFYFSFFLLLFSNLFSFLFAEIPSRKFMFFYALRNELLRSGTEFPRFYLVRNWISPFFRVSSFPNFLWKFGLFSFAQSIGAPRSGTEPFCRSAVGAPLREAIPERCRSAAPEKAGAHLER